jgi:hypothetical protein
MFVDARSMWVRFETYHDVTYFTPESRAATDALGCKGGWMGYFGMRAAPLGAAPARLVTALFYNFHPNKVARAIPEAWDIASPEVFLRTRLSGVDSGLRRMLPVEVLDGPELAEAAELLRRAAESTPTQGRALGAANLELPWPDEPHLVLWQAATVLREARGDGHVAALLAAGLDPCETLVMFGADMGLADGYLQVARGWSEGEWAAARERLLERGLVTPMGALTTEGSVLRSWIEERTDAAALGPWLAIGEPATVRVDALLTPLALRIARANNVMAVNPMALAAETELSKPATNGAS